MASSRMRRYAAGAVRKSRRTGVRTRGYPAGRRTRRVSAGRRTRRYSRRYSRY